MRFSLIIILFFTSLSFGGTVKFPPFVASQIEIVTKMNEDNITKEIIESLLDKQEELYNSTLNRLMINKTQFIKDTQLYTNEIFSLKKIILINKRAGNNYAVLRDEVALKIYLVLQSQNRMVRQVLIALDSPTKGEFETKLGALTNSNKQEVHKLYEKNYDDILLIDSNSKILQKAKENIKDFYALKEVNTDMISYLYKLSTKMYRLNKYTKYHLISAVVYVSSIPIVKVINPILEDYNLSVIKLFSIIFLIVITYLFRKIVYIWLERYLFTREPLKEYASKISKKIYKQIDIVIIIININLVFYVFNDFSSGEFLSRSFNIIYGFFFTLIIYNAVNTIASIKLSKVDDSGTGLKNDVVNVGIKIVNFLIIVMGLLIILFFAGVNLTAVLSGLGIGGLAVAFAAKDTISNFFGTLSILFSDVFVQGDWIQINEHQGVVVEIGLRVTTIRTFDNALIAIPNGTFASSDVKNWDKRTLGRRIKMSIGVTYGSKREDIQNAVKEIRAMLHKHDGIVTKETQYAHKFNTSHVAKLVSRDDLQGVKKTLLVYLDEFSDSSINILVYCFTKSVEWRDWLETKEDIMYKIMAILEQNNLEFAFPSLTVYKEE